MDPFMDFYNNQEDVDDDDDKLKGDTFESFLGSNSFRGTSF